MIYYTEIIKKDETIRRYFLNGDKTGVLQTVCRMKKLKFKTVRVK